MSKFTSYFLVFTASFCLMVMEITAGRLIAPYVGLSLYSWTSIIGVFLSGISLGNWVGGKIADRKYSLLKSIGIIFILSSLSSLLIIFILPLWDNVTKSDLWIPGLIAFFSLITFFPAAFFLSFVTPLIIKINLNKIEKTGRTVGNIYSISTAGSISGTFLTAFSLIPSFGTRFIVVSIFFILAATGFYFLFKNIKKKNPVFILFIITVLAAGLSFFQKSICEAESQYYCIRIQELKIEGSNQKGIALVLDKLDHGFLYSPGIDPFGYGSFRIFGNLISYKFKRDDKFKVLALGGGAYILPRYILSNYKNSEVTVLEIDPAVTKFNFERLGLKDNPRLKIIHGDARVSLSRLKQKYDFILADVFTDFLVPYHLTTQEFIKKSKEHLLENGIYAMNLIDNAKFGQFLSSNLLTVSSVFSKTYLFPLSPQWQRNIARQTSVIAGTDKTIDNEKWMATAPYNDPLWKSTSKEAIVDFKSFVSVQDRSLKNFIAKSEGIVLTDDYAPVESMLTSLYQKKY